MPPEYPRLSGKEVRRALETLGFEAIRQKGSHLIMKCNDKTCVVPMHRELKTGTLAGVLKQAGVHLDTFKAAL